MAQDNRVRLAVSVALLVACVSAGYPTAHKPAAYTAPSSYSPKQQSYDDTPACTKNTTKPWCLADYEYPTYELQHALELHYDTVLSLYKDFLVNTDNSVEKLKTLPQETYLCPSYTSYVQPLRARNVDGKWRVVVNQVEVKYYPFTQTVRMEECKTGVQGYACPLVAPCYESKCLQKNIYHRFLVFDAYDQYFPFAVESFKLPASCACLIGAYHDSY